MSDNSRLYSEEDKTKYLGSYIEGFFAVYLRIYFEEIVKKNIIDEAHKDQLKNCTFIHS